MANPDDFLKNIDLSLYDVHFNYNSKFLLTLTMRADGSTKFGEQNRYGYFPSGAFAYRLIEEDFLKNQSILSDLKFRVSYGQTGNSNIGQNAYPLFAEPTKTIFKSGNFEINIAAACTRAL